MNNCIITGGITRDAELSFTNSGTAMCKFGMANTTGFGDKEQTNYFDLIIWGKRAEGLNQYLKKGKQIIVNAEARYSTWEKDGTKRSKIDFHVQAVDFQKGNKNDGQQQNSPKPASNQQQGQGFSQPAPQQPTPNTGYPSDFVDDDIPF